MAKTIYIPSFFSPEYKSLDMTLNQTFTAQVNGLKYTDYRLVIKKVSDNTVVYDSTKLSLSPVLYDKQTLSHLISANSISNTGTDSYKWILQVWNGSENVTSGETLFYAESLPVIGLTIPTTVTSKSISLISTYMQTEGISPKKFKYIWYDNLDNIIKDTGWIFSGNLSYDFDGLDNNSSYKIECMIETLSGVIGTSGKKAFAVTYVQPSLTIVPETTLLPNLSAIKVKWSKVITRVGATTGTTSYIPNFLKDGNYGLQIDADSKLEYNFTIPKDFTVTNITKFPVGFSGIFCQLDSDYSIGYDGSRFYFNNAGIIEYGTAVSIDVNPFFICIRPTSIIIKKLSIYKTWSELTDGIWGDLTVFAWGDLA